MESISIALILFVSITIFCGILHGVAINCDFFKIQKNERHYFFDFKILILIILLFLTVTKILSTLILEILTNPTLFLNRFLNPATIKMLGFSLSSILTIFLVVLIGYSQNPKAVLELIGFKKERIATDLKLGVYTFILAISSVTAVGILLQLFTYWIFGQSGNEQLIITYLREHKAAFGVKFLGFLNIVIFAPTLEEFIFRGCIQRYLTSLTSLKNAILITSILFAFVHFSSDQGVGNIALLSCIFILSIYLGFIYEKTSCLISPIIVHMLFNLDGIARIFLAAN